MTSADMYVTRAASHMVVTLPLHVLPEVPLQFAAAVL